VTSPAVPEPRPDLVEVVARAVAEDRAVRWGYDVTLVHAVASYVERLTQDANLLADVAAALAALDSAGVLMPAGGQTREEWGSNEGGEITPCPRRDCPRAFEHTHRRTVTTYPDGSTYTTAWTETTDD
jgi:hypothetical protein